MDFSKRFVMCLMPVILLWGSGRTPASAGQISLRTATSARFQQGQLRVSVDVENAGNDAAEGLALEATLGDDAVGVAGPGVLGPGGRWSDVLVLDNLPAVGGVHTIVLALRYSDRAGHPYSVLEFVPVVTGDPGNGSAISGDMGMLRMVDEGALRMRLRMRHTDPKGTAVLSVAYRLVLPDEFECAAPMGRATVTADRSFEQTFSIRNRWATRNSRYHVFAVLDYVHAGVHLSDVVESTIRVEPLRGLTRRSLRVWWSVAFAFFAMFVALQFELAQKPRS